MALYDRIASIYDPWSRSVTEDIGFYVEQALASGGPVVELAVGLSNQAGERILEGRHVYLLRRGPESE